MRRQGFEDLRLPHREYLPLKHNSPEAIDAELRSKEVLDRLAAIVGAESNVIERTRFRVYADSLALTPEESAFFDKYPGRHLRMEAQMTRWELWVRKDGTNALIERIQNRVVRYVAAGISGHTKDYATDSIAETPPDRSKLSTLRDKVLSEYPTIPSKWLLETTNTFVSVVNLPPKGSPPNVRPTPDKHEAVTVTNHIFRIVDGLVTWEYWVAENKSDVDVDRHDSQEDDPAKAKLFAEARTEVDTWMERKGLKGKFGSVHAYWPELKRVLKTRYSIDWLSPQDLHPSREYD